MFCLPLQRQTKKTEFLMDQMERQVREMMIDGRCEAK